MITVTSLKDSLLVHTINWSGFLSLNRLVRQFLRGVGLRRGVAVQDDWTNDQGCPADELKVENEAEEENCNKNKTCSWKSSKNIQIMTKLFYPLLD